MFPLLPRHAALFCLLPLLAELAACRTDPQQSPPPAAVLSDGTRPTLSQAWCLQRGGLVPYSTEQPLPITAQACADALTAPSQQGVLGDKADNGKKQAQLGLLHSGPLRLDFGATVNQGNSGSASPNALWDSYLSGGLYKDRLLYEGHYSVNAIGSETTVNSLTPGYSDTQATVFGGRKFSQQLSARGPTLIGAPLQLSSGTERLESLAPGGGLLGERSMAGLKWAPGLFSAGLNWTDSHASDDPAYWGRCDVNGSLQMDLKHSHPFGAKTLALSGRHCTTQAAGTDSVNTSSVNLVNSGGAELVWKTPGGETGLRGALVRYSASSEMVSYPDAVNPYTYDGHGTVIAWDPFVRPADPQISRLHEQNTDYRVGLRQARTWGGWTSSADFAWTVAEQGPQAVAAHDNWVGRAQLSRPLAQGLAVNASWLHLAPGDIYADNLAVPGEQWVLGLDLGAPWFSAWLPGIPASAGLNWHWVRPDGAFTQVQATHELSLGLTLPFR